MESKMGLGKGRLEAFSDGVIAILITIMVLELKVPHNTDWETLSSVAPIFLSYILSFIYIGIYWNNHHHMFHLCTHTNGKILWANLHFLFWLSLIPFATGWLGENHFDKTPAAAYGIVLFMTAISYWILQSAIIHSQKNESVLKEAIGDDLKGKISPILYLIAIATAYFYEWVTMCLYVIVAIIWLIPDPRIEKRFH